MKIVNYIISALMGLMLFGTLGSEAWGQSGLEQRLQVLEQTNARSVNLLTQIQQEFQSIRGQIDASRYLDQENDRVYRDLDLRVSGLEDKIDQIHRLLKEMAANQTGGQPMKTPTSAKEYEEYQALLLLVNSRDYRAAASGFMGFSKKYPNSPYNAQALYWTGESFYSMGDYARAIKEFQQLVQSYPQDPRVKEAIFKQGLAFGRLQKYPEAKLFFQKVMASYPNSAEAAKAQSRLHWIEEMEKNKVALGEASKPSGASPSGTPPGEAPKPQGTPPSGEGSANRPITKVSPYPKPPTVTPPPSAPVPTQVEDPVGETGSRPETTTGKDPAPLF